MDIKKTRQRMAENLRDFEENCREKKFKEAANNVRWFIEPVINAYYEKYVSEEEVRLSAEEKINNLPLRDSIDRDLKDKLHQLRKLGNAGVHDKDLNHMLEQLEEDQGRFLGMMKSVLECFDRDFETTQNQIKAAIEEYLSQYLPFAFGMEFRKVDLTSLKEGEATFDLWFDAYVMRENPFRGEAVCEWEEGTGNATMKSILVRHGQVTCLHLRDGSVSGCWVEESILKSRLITFLIGLEELKGMDEDYYRKSLMKVQEKATLLQAFDVMVKEGTEFFQYHGQDWFISEEREILPLTGAQRIERAIDKMSRETLRLFCWRIADKLSIHRMDWREGFTIRELQDPEEGRLLVGENRSSLDLRIGYRYLNEGTQFFYLLTKDGKVAGKYPVNVEAPHEVDMDEEYELPGRSLDIDYEALFKDALAIGCDIPERLAIHAKEYREERLKAASVSHSKETRRAEEVRLQQQRRAAEEREEKERLRLEERAGRKKRIKRTFMLAFLAVILCLILYAGAQIRNIDPFEDFEAEFKGYSPRISLINSQKVIDYKGIPLSQLFMEDAENGRLMENQIVTLKSKQLVGPGKEKSFQVKGEGRYIDDFNELSETDRLAFLEDADEKIADFYMEKMGFRTGIDDAEYMDYSINRVEQCFAVSKKTESEYYNIMMIAYQIHVDDQYDKYIAYWTDKKPIEKDLYVVIRYYDLAVDQAGRLVSGSAESEILYEALDRIEYRYFPEKAIAGWKYFQFYGYGSLEIVNGEVFAPLKQDYELKETIVNQ